MDCVRAAQTDVQDPPAASYSSIRGGVSDSAEAGLFSFFQRTLLPLLLLHTRRLCAALTSLLNWMESSTSRYSPSHNLVEHTLQSQRRAQAAGLRHYGNGSTFKYQIGWNRFFFFNHFSRVRSVLDLKLPLYCSAALYNYSYSDQHPYVPTYYDSQ